MNILDYYDYNIAKGTAIVENKRWTTAAEPTITMQPGTDDCDFIESITFLVDDLTTFGGNTLRITNYGYGATTYQEAADLAELISFGDSDLYRQVIVTHSGAIHNMHYITIKFAPPKYLKSSTVPAESIVISLEGGGHLATGFIDITVKGWTCLEDESGI